MDGFHIFIPSNGQAGGSRGGAARPGIVRFQASGRRRDREPARPVGCKPQEDSPPRSGISATPRVHSWAMAEGGRGRVGDGIISSGSPNRRSLRVPYRACGKPGRRSRAKLASSPSVDGTCLRAQPAGRARSRPDSRVVLHDQRERLLKEPGLGGPSGAPPPRPRPPFTRRSDASAAATGHGPLA